MKFIISISRHKGNVIFPFMLLFLISSCVTFNKSDDYSKKFIFGKTAKNKTELINVPVTVSIYENNEVILTKTSVLHFIINTDSIGKGQIVFYDMSINECSRFKNNNLNLIPYLTIEEIFRGDSLKDVTGVWEYNINFGACLTILKGKCEIDSTFNFSTKGSFNIYKTYPVLESGSGYVWSGIVETTVKNEIVGEARKWEIARVDTVLLDNQEIHQNSKLKMRVFIPKINN